VSGGPLRRPEVPRNRGALLSEWAAGRPIHIHRVRRNHRGNDVYQWRLVWRVVIDGRICGTDQCVIARFTPL